jgi:hypothetical protein
MTTGQPIKYPSDRNKYNNEFNTMLQLQIDLNQKNLEANRLYKETGQLPASTQMQDTRSTEEKLADIESLKRSIASDLAPVAEPAFAHAVIQGVLDSPLNINNSLFRYLAQNASTFAQSLGKKYKFGIAGDANDVEVMVQFLEDAYNKTKNSFQSIKGYIDSNTNQGIRTKSNTLSANDTDNVKTELRDIIKRVEYLRRSIRMRGGHLSPESERMIDGLVHLVNIIDRNIPTSMQMSTIINNISEYVNAGAPNPMTQSEFAVFKILSELPRLASIQTIVDNIEKGILNGDARRIDQSINNFQQLFANFINPTNMVNLQAFRDRWITMADDEIRDKENADLNKMVQDKRLLNQHTRDEAHAQRVYVINPGDDPVKVIPYANGVVGFPGPPPPLGGPPPYGGGGGGSSYSSTPVAPSMSISDTLGQAFSSLIGGPSSSSSSGSTSLMTRDAYIDANVARLTDDGLRAMVPAILNHPIFTRFLHPDVVQNLQNNLRGMGRQQKYDYIVSTLKSLPHDIYDPSNAQNPINNVDVGGQPGISGLGLKRVKKGRGISTKYRDFGEHEINHKNLEKGIFTMRRKTKSNIMGLPSKHVSKHFQNIIHNIMGGKIADFNDIHNLSDDEKNYLHKIISKSNLQDRLSIPAPSKDQQEKDFHNFEVMKGEILAGNDSKELIKNFKVLTMKLTRQNLLPKNEVMELFEDLVSLGY